MRIYKTMMKINAWNYVSKSMYTLPKIKKGVKNP